jgi:hypothetical protein
MRAFALGLITAFAIAAAFDTAGAIPAPRSDMAAMQASPVVPVAHKCPKGQRWIPAGYAAKGKYRAGHCARG